MTDPSADLHAALEAAGCEPRGPVHSFSAKCPAHDDTFPSLGVKEGSDGRALVLCRRGCEANDVMRALGLGLRDLFPRSHELVHGGRRLQLASESALSSLRRVLVAAGIRWRETAAEEMIVADECPVCGKAELWIHDDGRRLVASCWTDGCASDAILAALRESMTEGGDRAAA